MVRNERLGRNEESQHYRSDHYIKIVGIPIQNGEEVASDGDVSNTATLGVINSLVQHCGIDRYDNSQVDVCHRIGKDIYSPIIVKFFKKRDRYNFYKQKVKLGGIKSPSLGLALSPEQKSAILNPVPSVSPRGRGAHSSSSGIRNQLIKDGNIITPYVSIYEHLTKLNSDLLKKAKDRAYANNFKYRGYTVGGEVRVKKSDQGKFISIKDYGDLDKIF